MTEILENDQLSMNRINPYTATGTFGVSYNGGHKSTETLPWMLPRQEEVFPAVDEPDEFKDHFDPKAIFRAPAMNLMTGSVDPATSFMFPARKYQFDDGTTSWSRETRYIDGRNYVNLPLFGATRWEMFPIVIVLVLLVILLGLQKKLNL